MSNLIAQVDEPIGMPTFLGDVHNFSIGNILGWALRLVFVAAGFFVFYNLIFGALEWIQSGGDKEKVEKARKRITTAVTGLVILFVVIGAIVLIEQVFNIGMGFTKNIVITRFARPN